MKYRSTEAHRAMALGYVKSLNDRAIAEFFYEALAEKARRFGEHERTHWVIAQATTTASDDDSHGTIFQAIALPDRSQYEADGTDIATLGPAGPCEDGDCERCGIPCCSWAKHMLCPVCGEEVYGT